MCRRVGVTLNSIQVSYTHTHTHQDESVAMRQLIVSKQATKRGRKQERKMAKALAVIKVSVFSYFVQFYSQIVLISFDVVKDMYGML